MIGSRRARTTLLVALLAWVAACSPAPDPGFDAAPAGGRARHVLLLSIDTLRADRWGCLGGTRGLTLFLDVLAERGTLFTAASASAPWTLPSHASMLTGRHPHRHGAARDDARIARDVPTLAGELSRAGFHTAALVNSLFLGRRHGLARGFDEFAEIPERPKAGRLILERATDWLERRRNEPAFLLVHLYDVHSPYEPAPPFADALPAYDGPADGSTGQLLAHRSGRVPLAAAGLEHMQRLYDAEVAELDALLADVFARLRARDLLDDTLVVITSDHGEEFGEHGGVLHGRTLYQELLHVPLLWLGPGVPAGVRRGDPASHVDLMPTLLAALGLPSPGGLDGVDLFAPGAEQGGRLVFAGADHNNAEPDTLRMLGDGRFKLVWDRLDGTHRVFDLQRDPGETVDVAAERPEVAAYLTARLEVLATDGQSGAPIDTPSDDELQRLRELGYLGDVPGGER